MKEHDGCSGCKYELLPDTSEQCKGCKQNAVDNYTKMTNADKIRAMTDDELAKFITSGEMAAICPLCIYDNSDDCYIKGYEEKNRNCDKGIMKWLKSEVEV